MKCLLFIYGITDLKLEKIGETIRPYAKEDMGFISMNKSAIINIDIVDNIPPEIVIQEAKQFTKQPIFMVDIETSRMAFTMNNEQSLSLFDEDFDSLCNKYYERGEQNPLTDDYEDDEENDIQTIIKNAQNNVSEYDLDNILDKISSKGFDSLDGREKKYLKNYGKHEG